MNYPNPSLEVLISQLLRQNAALHQELVAARGSSGSGSNVSQDCRAEGRQDGSSKIGVQRKGKGIGSESGTTFMPPYISFATQSESPAFPIWPSLDFSAGHRPTQVAPASYVPLQLSGSSRQDGGPESTRVPGITPLAVLVS